MNITEDSKPTKLRIQSDDMMMMESETQNYVHVLSKNQESLPAQPGHQAFSFNRSILIHARMRTGSTILGMYFSKDPNFFNIYEPGHFFMRSLDLNSHNDSTHQLINIQQPLIDGIHDFTKCDFRNHKEVFDFLTNVRWERRKIGIEQPSITLPEITSFCKSKQNFVTKVVRITDISAAYHVIERDDLKVIYLVRDPRGMMSSREVMERLDYTEQSTDIMPAITKFELLTQYYCHWIEVNIKSILSGPSWLRKHLIIVRYEDLADRPEDIVPKLYEFIGLPMHANVERMFQNDDSKRGNGEAWRYKLPYYRTQLVQDICSDEVFRMFGYMKIKSESDLIDKNLSTISDFSFKDTEVAL
ncbi:carbohydrate sulfotransferase 3-like [Glandiceps talaboti]